jgi:hypothetical protein
MQRAEAATRELREERAIASRIFKNIEREKASSASPDAPPSTETSQTN